MGHHLEPGNLCVMQRLPLCKGIWYAITQAETIPPRAREPWEFVKSRGYPLIIWIYNSSGEQSPIVWALCLISFEFLAFKVFPVVTYTMIDCHLYHGQWFPVNVWQFRHYYQMLASRSAASSEFEIRPLGIHLTKKLLPPALCSPFDGLFIRFPDLPFSFNSFNCPAFPLLFYCINKNQTMKNVLVMFQMTITIAQLVPGNLHLTMKIHWTLKPLYINEEFMKKQPSEGRENQEVINGQGRHRCQNSCQMLVSPKSKENLIWILICLRRKHHN